MSNFRFYNKYFIDCHKEFWHYTDEFTAKCLNIEVDKGVHTVDIRIVSKKALVAYLERVFPQFMSIETEHRSSIFKRMGDMYSDLRDEFMNDFSTGLQYDRPMREHQIDTLFQSIHRRFNLWALDMGLGKTLTAATLSRIAKSARTIIICPAVVKYNWLEDMTQHWGYNPMEWTVLDSIKSKCTFAFDERFVVLNFEQVGKWMGYLLSKSVNHIIIDEAHYARNLKSLRSKNVRALIEAAPSARVTLLTGTPIVNRIDDLFSYLKLSGHPLGSNFEEFKREYTITGGRGNKVVGVRNLDQLKVNISNLMIRLVSEDVLDLPPLVTEKYYFEFDELQDEYHAIVQELFEQKKRYETSEGKEKAMLGREMKANIHTMNKLVATSKVPKVKELIEHITNTTGEKVIVFSSYRDPINRLEEMLGKSCVKIDGSVSAHKRSVLVKEFIEKPTKKVFLANMVAGGIGINLVNARHVIYLNFPFTPDQMKQSIKRAHRSGQTRKVFGYYTIAKGTIDEHIFRLMSDKDEDINALIDGDNDNVIDYKDVVDNLFSNLLEKNETLIKN